MKINCGPTKKERARKRRAELQAVLDHYRDWHRWFAWFPVRIGSGDCRWLEYVERRYQSAFVPEHDFQLDRGLSRTGSGWGEYRAIK